jgi:TPR repeat protein
MDQRGQDAYNRQDYATALQEWYPLAQRGYPTAQFRLGSMYEQGQGVAQDLAEAQRWFAKAAKAYPPGTNRKNALLARDRVARQLAAAQPPAPAPLPSPPASVPASPTLQGEVF